MRNCQLPAMSATFSFSVHWSQSLQSLCTCAFQYKCSVAKLYVLYLKIVLLKYTHVLYSSQIAYTFQKVYIRFMVLAILWSFLAFFGLAVLYTVSTYLYERYHFTEPDITTSASTLVTNVSIPPELLLQGDPKRCVPIFCSIKNPFFNECLFCCRT